MTPAFAENSLVLPQWLPWASASQLPEASAPMSIAPSRDATRQLASLCESVEAFWHDPSPFIGCELMGLAMVQSELHIASKLAEYVLSREDVGLVARDQAMVILGMPTGARKELPAKGKREKEIAVLKGRLRLFPGDSIAWIDQARLYTILGQKDPAEKCVRAALQLSPTSRHIVRAAVRFFTHFGEWDTAGSIALRAFESSNDPLVYGPLLSVFTHLDRVPPRLKSIVATGMASTETHLYSEVLEGMGTLEVKAGARVKAKKLFRRAWENPTKAVVSHSQWVLRTQFPTMRVEGGINYNSNVEALSSLYFYSLNLREALAACIEWELEEPYSKRPAMLGSGVACMLDDFGVATDIAKRGLRANPHNDILRNNLVFALLRSGDVSSAEREFAPLLHTLEEKDAISQAATYGLLLMSKGEPEAGTEYYSKAISRAADKRDFRMATAALLNYLISCLETTGTADLGMLSQVPTWLERFPDPNCIAIADTVLNRLRRVREQGTVDLTGVEQEIEASIGKEKSKLRQAEWMQLLPPPPAALEGLEESLIERSVFARNLFSGRDALGNGPPGQMRLGSDAQR